MRSTQRLTGTAKKTVERLLVLIGEACAKYHDEHVRNLGSAKVQVDEIWSFVGAKEKRTPEAQRGTAERGDVWTWTAIDADSKLIITWHTGTHLASDAHALIGDLYSRLANRVQLSTDGLKFYPTAVEAAFGTNIDFAQIIKIFERKPSGKYSPPVCIGTTKHPRRNPDSDEISTSYVERQNMTIRMGNRRFTRLTNAFSKKLENHRHSIALHFMHYNFCRIHQTLRVTPAMAAGLTNHVWELHELAALVSTSSSK
jgi:IS1 family transposase